MGGDVVELLDSVDRAVAASEGVVDPASTARAAGRAAELRSRRGFQGQTLVLAIAGGTGTGKSSLLNAIAGEPVASVSRLRPHTQRPMAWIPAGRGPALDEMLDQFGILERSEQSRRPGLALIDLPDMDSVEAQHRRTVEDLIPRVDGVVWVFDPTKYHDPVLHDGFLRPLADYRDQFVFVLNKIDLLDPDHRAEVGREVRRSLEQDGYPDSRFFMTAAAPADGEPRGIVELEAFLGEQLDAKRTAVAKWLIDTRRELEALGAEAGVWDGASLDLRDRWVHDRDAAAAGILSGRGPGSRSDAVCRLEDLVAMVAVEAGPRVGEKVRELFPEGSVEEALDAAADEATLAANAFRRRRKAEEAGLAAARGVLDDRVWRPLRSALSDRARLGAALVEAALRVVEAEAELAGGTVP